MSPAGSDSNDGSAGAPWLTISHSIGFVHAGDVVHVAPGTYNENVVFDNVGGTPSAHIRYISDVQYGAKIVGVSGAEAAFWVHSGSGYIDVIGFDVSHPGGTQGIECYAPGCRILGNLVHNVPGSSSGGACIHTYPNTATNIVIKGNIVHDCGPFSTTVQLTQGIYIESAGAVVDNNLVYNSQGFGICLFHTPYNDTITNNVVFSNGWGGIVISGTSSEYPGGSGVDDYTTVSNNIVRDNGLVGGAGRGGILEDPGSALGAHNVYYNNIVTGNRSGGSTANSSQLVLQNGAQAGNQVNVDPQFVNYQPNGSGDYHLASGSPAIGQGSFNGAVLNFPGPPTIDLAGSPRDATKNDIGVYVFGGAPATWPWY